VAPDVTLSPDGDPVPAQAPRATAPARPLLIQPDMSWATTLLAATSERLRGPVPAVLASLARSGELPTLPAAAAAALAIVRDPEADAADLCEVIRTDIGLSARIVRVANSVAYGRRRPAKTLADAVFTVGVRKTCDLLVAAAVRQLYVRPHPRAGALWQHALAVATAAEELAAVTQQVTPATAFLPGLFHDVGRIAFLVADAAGLDAVESRYVGGEGDRIALELAQFGVDHTEAGAILAEDWGLSAVQADAIRHHHAPEDAGDGAALASILRAADALAHELGFGSVAGNELAPAAMGLSPDDAAFCRERVRHAFEIQNALLS